jgi:uncharacterized protein YcbX
MPATLASLHIYPVKGLKGIDLAEARVMERGLEHDRRFMVVDPEGGLLTQRDLPKMATVWTEIAGGELRLSAPDRDEVALAAQPAEGDALSVRVWKTTCDAIAPSRDADRWLTEYLGRPSRLVYMPETTRRTVGTSYGGEEKAVSFADGYPFLVTTHASLDELNSRMAAKLPMNRFRPNLVVSGTGAWEEDGWGDIRVGDAAFRVTKPCGRCQVTTTDQATGEVRGPEPLATLTTYRDSTEFGVKFGMNAIALATGTLRTGMPVSITTIKGKTT